MKVCKEIRYLTALLVMMTISLSALAQNIAVSGTVLDELGDPLIGAKVMQVGAQKNAVLTDIEGNFNIKVPAKATLEVSYVGYDVVKVEVNGRTNIEIQLKPNTQMLDEVVAIGYGTVKKKTLPAPYHQYPAPSSPRCP